VRQMVDRMLTGTVDYDYSMKPVTELDECGFWFEQELQYDLPYKLSPVATRMYMAVEHEIFCFRVKEQFGLTREEYEQGLIDLVSSGTVAFRLTSPINGEMSSELTQKAYECICGMSEIITKYIQNDDRDHTSPDVAQALFNSMTAPDKKRYIELDNQRIQYCLDAEQMSIRQSEEITGNKAPEREHDTGTAMRPLGPFASGFIPNVRIVDSCSYSHYNNRMPLPVDTVIDLDNSERSEELASVSVECNGTDTHKLDSLLVSLEPTSDRSPSGLTAFSTPKSETDVRLYEIDGKQVSRATYFRRRKDQERIEQERSRLRRSSTYTPLFTPRNDR
jgi:hypothetical protein